METKNRPNIILLVIIFFLFFIGILVLSTASAPYSISRKLSADFLITHQLLYGILPGLILGAIAYKINLNFVKKHSFIIFLLAYIGMWLVFIPGLSMTEYGATRWLKLGPLGGFQPSEALKLATIIYASALMSAKKTPKEKLQSIAILLGAVGLVLLCQSNLSTMIIICTLAMIIFFTSGTPLKYTVGIFSLAGIAFFCFMISSSYRLERWKTFWNPELDPLDKGYHISQALIAIGSGGVFGSGLGLGEQKFGFVPESISDSIFTIYAAETGFIGSVILIGLFAAFTYMAFRIARKHHDNFCKFIAVGIGSWISLQAFVNISAMTGLLPLSGTPLPFLTYGSSHVIFELIACGLLLNVSKGIKA
ncbi:MAG: putative peptidoglycan glycosyltransferase FtsW [Candidatus Paceibacterota bacterium]|jgi:cell division protein FtsW|nr:FtsW/RodA/SpoVE family cell cycle protein [bacterium]